MIKLNYWLARFFGKHPTKYRQYRRDRLLKQVLGFTLIEVLVVMIIVGILSAIAAPGWLAYMNNQRLNASQTQIFQAIKTAQSEAKSRKLNDTQGDATSVLRTGVVFQQISTSEASLQLNNVKINGGVQKLADGVTITKITAKSVEQKDASNRPYIKLDFNSKGLLYGSDTLIPVCINIASSSNTSKVRSIEIQTLLGAVVTGEKTCT
ncbi:MAG: type II secretion system protein [Pseudanabaenaceae cyanobacterium bins.39]|nr:type II secretion system protein [Pseudanabaenaceae cyanobacterium bins.39]